MKADNLTEKAVMAFLEKFAESYTKRDMRGVMSLIAPDADVIIYGTEADEKRVGLKEIQTQLERDWAQTETLSLEYNKISVSAAGTVAWVAIDSMFKAKIKGYNLFFPARVTKILEKRENKWLLVHGHFSLPDIKQQLLTF